MIEILLFGLLKGLLVGAAVITIASLTFAVIKEWFLANRNTLSSEESEAIAVTIKKDMEDGSVGYVQGFFDRNSEEMVKHRVIRPENVASDVAELHRNHNVVVYE